MVKTGSYQNREFAGSGGAADLSFGEGFFAFTDLPAQSFFSPQKGKKLVFEGVYTSVHGQAARSVPACAAYFAKGDPAYSRERVGLTVGGILGVGPRLLESDVPHRLPRSATEDVYPLIIEEHAGVSLREALEGAPLPFFDGTSDRLDNPLPKPGSEDGDVASHKILFDVLTQLYSLSRHRLYHRDLHSANIALRAHGPRPEDVRATLIDFEFLTMRPSFAVWQDDYYSRLQHLLGHAPTAFEQDAGYIALVMAEVLLGRPLDRLRNDELREVMEYPSCPFDPRTGLCRAVTRYDLDREAREARLPTAREEYGQVSDRAVRLAEDCAKHAGRIDALDRARLATEPELALELQVSDFFARRIFSDYQEQRRVDGRPIEYASFESQPEDLRRSCVSQAQNTMALLESLGLSIVFVDECPACDRVRAFRPEEVEFLAKREHERWYRERTEAGWAYGPVKDIKAKVSPYLIPYEDLSEEMKGYDREPVGKLIANLEEIGLAVVRR